MYRAVKKKLNYQSPAILQQAEVLLELAFLTESTVDDGLRSGGVFSNYQVKGETVTDADLDGWD